MLQNDKFHGIHDSLAIQPHQLHRLHAHNSSLDRLRVRLQCAAQPPIDPAVVHHKALCIRLSPRERSVLRCHPNTQPIGFAVASYGLVRAIPSDTRPKNDALDRATAPQPSRGNARPWRHEGLVWRQPTRPQQLAISICIRNPAHGDRMACTTCSALFRWLLSRTLADCSALANYPPLRKH